MASLRLRWRGFCTAPAGFAQPSRVWRKSSLRCGALGMKCGMTQAWQPDGKVVPLTIIEVQDVQVVQAKRVPTSEGEGLNLQLGSGWQKRKRLNRPDAGQFESRGLPLKRYLREFRVSEDAQLPVGTTICARHFVPGQFVDVQGTSKGKGFEGVMRRYGFAGQPRSHGHSLSHRSGGSLGGAAGSMYATRVMPGKKMPGRMGGKVRTAHSLLVYRVDAEHGLVYLKGTIPGGKGSPVRLKDATRKRMDTSGRGHHRLPPFPTWLPGDDETGGDVTEAPLARPL